SMLIVTSMYVLVAVTAIGARRWQWFETAQAPLVQIVEEITGSNLAVLLFAVAAVLAILSVVISVLCGQSRILLPISRGALGRATAWCRRSSASCPDAPALPWPGPSSSAVWWR